MQQLAPARLQCAPRLLRGATAKAERRLARYTERRLAAARGEKVPLTAIGWVRVIFRALGILALLIVFVPLVFSDSSGSRWTKDLGYMVCASVFSSLWVALSVVPLLASRVLSPRLGRPSPARAVAEAPAPAVDEVYSDDDRALADEDAS